ncbi:RNA-binding S4 domain-containing protein [Azospirillum sp. TSO22-1]|uniref:RNA-binding S4 domain-containing protein n=1 Tax=Azospirillum sp. TSO22-1 TaxID=716789 RepID=UPI000D61ACDD|nr:RNA-binding S4 domain-containing protein [Azospirillum sp. TSO22-1]PWC52915.1 tRNA synthetase RNA-binding protein [Azospirillum sp. TSO22-1]
MTTDHDDDFDDGQPDPGGGRLRIDKWLWFARFFKTRSLAAKVCNGGVVRCSGSLVTKAHYAVKPGDVLTFPQGRHIRVVKVLAPGSRRGPAEEARTLYEDLSPPAPETAMDVPGRPQSAGRPSKRDRRALERLKVEE